MTREIYSEMTLVDLKNKAKELGIKNISKLKKSELIDELVKVCGQDRNRPCGIIH